MALIEDVKEKILHVVRNYRVAAGNVLPARVLMVQMQKWTPPEQRLLEEAMQALVQEGIFEERDGMHFLTHEGELQVYR